MKKGKLYDFVVLLMVALIFIIPMLKKDMQKRPLFQKLGYTPHGKIYRASLGEFRWIMGDYLAFKSIIYYGGKADYVRERLFNRIEYYNLYQTIKTAILLNPYNEDAYYFAQAAFTWDIGKVRVVNRLLEYVLKYRKWDFKVPFFLGFNYAYFLKDYKKAAYYYKMAADINHSSLFTSLAARYLYEGGETELGIQYLKYMIKITHNKQIKKQYEIRLQALEAIHKIGLAVEKYKKRFGILPKSIDELIKSGILRHIPKDPYGGKFYIDKNGKVKTTSKLVFLRGRK